MRRPIVFLAVILLFIAGCKKSVNKPNTDPPLSENLLLSSAIVVNPNNASDTLIKIHYVYDLKNRLIASYTFNASINKTDTDTYAYDDIGNLVKETYHQLGIPPSTILFNREIIWTYVNGSPATEANSSNYGVVQNYTVNDGKVTGLAASTYNAPQWSFAYEGNIIKKIRLTTQAPDTTFITYQYGNKKDPFFVSGIKQYLSYDSNITVSGQNEIISVIINTGADTIGNISYVHTYNSVGYPVKSVLYSFGKIYTITYNTYIDAKTN